VKLKSLLVSNSQKLEMKSSNFVVKVSLRDRWTGLALVVKAEDSEIFNVEPYLVTTSCNSL
jgi:hypothetical protein